MVRRATLSFQLVLTKSGSGQESNPLDYTTAELEQCGASEHVMQVLGHRSCKHLHRHIDTASRRVQYCTTALQPTHAQGCSIDYYYAIRSRLRKVESDYSQCVSFCVVST